LLKQVTALIEIKRQYTDVTFSKRDRLSNTGVIQDEIVDNLQIGFDPKLYLEISETLYPRRFGKLDQYTCLL